MKEAAKLGFDLALAPAAAGEGAPFRVSPTARLADAIARIGQQDWPKGGAK